MNATLYLPRELPKSVPTGDLFTIGKATGYVQIPLIVSALLGCAPKLVDVLASSEGYVVFTVFDSEDEANPTAMQAAAELTGIDFDTTDEGELLRGPVLIVKK